MSQPQTPKEYIDLYTEAVAQHAARLQQREGIASEGGRKVLATQAIEQARLAQEHARSLAHLYQDRDPQTGYAWQEVSDQWKGHAGR